jgi:hypothetical protein
MAALEIPVIIGVGDVKNRSIAVDDAKEPATLILEAIEIAIQDSDPFCTSDLQSAIDSIDVVKTWTWPYPDLPGLLAQKLGVDESLKWKRYSEHGGDKPGKLFDDAAKRIAKGECKVAVVTGGEALASCAYYVHLFVLSRPAANSFSICLCSSEETSSARLDSSIRSRGLSLYTHGSRSRKQCGPLSLANTFFY